MSWNDDIKKIMEIVPQIELLQKNANKTVKAEYDDSKLRSQIDNLDDLVRDLASDLLSIKRAESSARTYQELNGNMESRICRIEAQIKKIKDLPADSDPVSFDPEKIQALIDKLQEQDAMVYLKRAESSARTCEELMVSMEKRVNDLSKRLKNGN